MNWVVSPSVEAGAGVSNGEFTGATGVTGDVAGDVVGDVAVGEGRGRGAAGGETVLFRRALGVLGFVFFAAMNQANLNRQSYAASKLTAVIARGIDEVKQFQHGVYQRGDVRQRGGVQHF